jgi:hypothetical protein
MNNTNTNYNANTTYNTTYTTNTNYTTTYTTNTYTTTVTRTSSRYGLLPKVTLSGWWLARMGFTLGSLVQAVPEENGFCFRLADENEPYAKLKAKGSNLIHVSRFSSKSNFPALSIIGKTVATAGFAFGDGLIARYQYGLIRLRKLPPKTKFVPGQADEKVRMAGAWLGHNGFVPGMFATAVSTPKLVTVRLWEGGLAPCADFVQLAREKRIKLLRTSWERRNQSIDIPFACFGRSGFWARDEFLAKHEYGVIWLRKLELESLGF